MTSRPPLAGYRVLDISQHMAGPSATQRLGDLGADIIKVEPPGEGEWSRTRTIGNGWAGGMSTSFLSLNCNKRSIAIDLKHDDGYRVFAALAREVDVLILNFRPDVRARLKVDWDTMHALNPRLVYCSITGFGSSGPIASRPGQDLLLQAYSGLAWNGGRSDDPPTPAAAFLADATTGNHAAIGILGALVARAQTGHGQEVEVNLLASLLDVQTQELTTFLNTGVLPERSDERLAHPYINGPYGVHRTRDGWVAIAMGDLPTMGEALGVPELARFPEWADGMDHRDEIFRLVAEGVSDLTTAEVIGRMDARGLWSGPVNTYAQLVDEPQVEHMGMVQRIEGADGDEVRVLASPIRFSDDPDAQRVRPPVLGEHTTEILASIGIDENEADRLRASGAVQ